MVITKYDLGDDKIDYMYNTDENFDDFIWLPKFY